MELKNNVYRVSQIKVDWPISCDISKVYARIIAKFNTGDHELFASNFYFYNMFLRSLILSVLMHICEHFGNFFQAFYVFLEKFEFWSNQALFGYHFGFSCFNLLLLQYWNKIRPIEPKFWVEKDTWSVKIGCKVVNSKFTRYKASKMMKVMHLFMPSDSTIQATLKKHGPRIQLKSFWVHMRNFPNVYVNSFIPMVVILWLSSARNKICKLFSKNTFL